MKRMMKNTAGLTLAISLALSACGSREASKVVDANLPKVDFPIPEVSKDRPKTGPEALYNVPWTSKAGPKSDGTIMGKSYMLITKDTLSHVVLCTPIVAVTGKREWIAPTATVKIAWDGDTFVTLEEATSKETIQGKSCGYKIAKDITFKYQLKDEGETLILSQPAAPDATQELVIFRND